MSKYTFARASVATKLDGSQVATGIPRFETGQFGQAVMVEEGTTNLVTNGNFNNGLTGWNANLNVTLSTITESDGLTYGKCVSNVSGSTPGMISNQITASPSTTYTLSMKARRSGTNAHIYVTSSGGNLVWTGPLLSTNFSILKVMFTTGASATWVKLGVLLSPGVIGGWFEITLVQLEQKSYATSFIDGTRAAETLTIPTAGVFTKGNWTIEFIFTPHNLTGYSGNVLLWDCYIDASNRYGAYHDMARYLRFFATSNGIMYEIIDTSVLVVGTPYRITVSGNGSVLRLYKNGVQVGTNLAYVEPVGALPANMFIGSRWNSTGQCNGLIDDLRISNRARTGAEILAAYQSGVALPFDRYTTLKLNCDPTDNAADILLYNDGSVEPFRTLQLSSESRMSLMPETRDTSEEKDSADGDIDFGTDYGMGEFVLHGIIELEDGDDRYAITDTLKGQLNDCRTPQGLMYECQPTMYALVRLTGRPEIIENPHHIEVRAEFKADPFWRSISEYAITGAGSIVNAGTFETPLKIEIPGPATNPSISVGATVIAYSSAVAAGQTLVINTDTQTAYIGSVNAMASVVGNVGYMLAPGVSVAVTPSISTAIVKWRDRFI